MKFSDIKTENELKMWYERKYLIYWVIIPLVLIVIFLVYQIIKIERVNPYQGAAQQELEAIDAGGASES